ncbi:MAG: hypothetical protein AAF738_01955, partial [Bacteroidota bacterium]
DDYLRRNSYDKRAVERIRTTLKDYIGGGQRMTKFERQASILNVARIENLNLPFEAKLSNSLDLDLDERAKAELQQSIIAEATYADIPVVMNYYTRLSPILEYSFLHDDFGLPVFDLNDPEIRQAVTHLHKTSSSKQFYTHFLERFGINFQTGGKLDFQKIYNILRYDVVYPLSSDKQELRDYHVYGIIKLLEFRFNTRLGFHQKLNENQTLYQNTTQERARAWLDYLQRRKLAKPAENEVPSFY